MTEDNTAPPGAPEAAPKAPFSFTVWWEANKADYNAKRRARYRDNPEYKKRVRQINAESRKHLAEERAEERAEEESARLVEAHSPTWRTFQITVERDGVLVETEGFTIGALAAATRRSIQGLRLWERQGVIPPPDAKSPKGDRLYTLEAINTMVTRLDREGRLEQTGRQTRGLPRVEKTVRYSDGREELVVLFQVRAVARAMQRTIVTVQQLEARGVLPETPFRATSRKYRLYTQAQVASIVRRFKQQGGDLRLKPAQQAFHDAVLEDWRRLGLLNASLVEEEGESHE